jgi:response regulator of citrate/malate metabolism
MFENFDFAMFSFDMINFLKNKRVNLCSGFDKTDKPMKGQSMNTSPRYILLDDDIFTLAIATNIVRNHSRRAEVISFSECKKAIECIEAGYLKSKYPDTVLLTDFHMPDIDGFALLDRMEIMCKEKRGRLHIFVISAAACPDEIRKILSYSCVKGFYPKPFSFDKMDRIVSCIQHPQ